MYASGASLGFSPIRPVPDPAKPATSAIEKARPRPMKEKKKKVMYV